MISDYPLTRYTLLYFMVRTKGWFVLQYGFITWQCDATRKNTNLQRVDLWWKSMTHNSCDLPWRYDAYLKMGMMWDLGSLRTFHSSFKQSPIYDGREKKGSQQDRIFVYETCPNFVYEQYIRDGFQFGTHRECPTIGYVNM